MIYFGPANRLFRQVCALIVIPHDKNRTTNLSKNQLMYASLFIGPLEIPYRLIHSSEGDVGAGNYTNYTLKWPGTLRFVLKPIMGDPDLYISEGKKGLSHSFPFPYFHYDLHLAVLTSDVKLIPSFRWTLKSDVYARGLCIFIGKLWRRANRYQKFL